MQTQHYYEVGDIVLASVEAYPHWPAKVTLCLRNGSYRVKFLGENTQAVLLPKAVIDFSQPNLEKLRKRKEYGHYKNLKEAISLGEKLGAERMKGNIEEDEGIVAKKETQTRRKKPDLLQNSSFEKSAIENLPAERDAYIEMKELLDKFCRFLANFSQSESMAKFSKQDQGRLAFLLEPPAESQIREMVGKWVIERFILTVKEISQWRAPQNGHLSRLITDKYEQLAQIILSPDMGSYGIGAARQRRLVERVREGRVKVRTREGADVV